MAITLTLRGPEWFYGIDSLFEGFAFLALLFVVLFSFKAYRFTKDRRYCTFAIGFGLMALGMLCKGMTDFVVFLGIDAPGIVALAGYAGYMLLTLVSLVVLFGLTLKARQVAPLVALAFVSIALLLLSFSFRLSFHTASLMLLAFIARHFIVNYFRKKSLTALLVCLSFCLLALANVAFLADIIRQKFYIIGHIIHVLAFALLLVALLRVLRK